MFGRPMSPAPTTAQDSLTAALVLRRTESSRNRNFAIHATRDGAAARRRAGRIRGVVRQITGVFGPARQVEVRVETDEVVLRYSLARVALLREARISPVDLSIIRVALHRAGARLLPAALVARDEDRARVDALIEDFARARASTSAAP
jgi:hypothetical protein